MINNPPTVTNITTTVPYNAAATAIPPISGSDGDGTVIQYTVSSIPLPAQGVLYYCPLAPAVCTLAQLAAVTAGQNLTPAQANSLFFDPATGFSGTSTFSYTATDNNGNVSQPGNYIIGIANQPPVAQTINNPVMPNTNGATAIAPLIAADLDGTISSYTIHTIPPASQGVLLLSGVPVTTGQVLTPAQISLLQFDPNPAFTGVAEFAYSATDNSGNPSNLAFYFIPVSGAGNIPPVANPIIAPAMNSSNGATAIPSLVASDPDGTIASYTIETLPPAYQGVLLLSGVPVTTGQVLTPAQISQLQFDPAANFTGNAVFNYSATDNSGSISNITSYTIPINNLPPVANPIIAPAMPNSNGPTAIPSLVAADADGTISSYTILTLPQASQGVLLLSGVPVTAGQVLTPAQISQLQFDPAPGYTGEAVFNYLATDNNNLVSNVAAYTLYVTGVPPVSKDVVSLPIINTSGPTAIPSLSSTDADGSIATYVINSIPPASQGILLLSGVPVTAGQVLTPAQISLLQFDPASGFSGNALFNYGAYDNGGNLSNTATYVIPVIPVVILPVKLLSFDGKLAGGQTILNWITSQEINSHHFEVERSIDAANYQSIGSVTAAGYSTVSKKYGFTDINPVAGINYYRLKIVDKDGRYEYSNIVVIRINETVQINAWPNPFTDKVSISMQMERASTLHLRMTDMSGRILVTKNVNVQRGANQFNLDQLANITAGVYLVELTDEISGQHQLIKLIKK